MEFERDFQLKDKKIQSLRVAVDPHSKMTIIAPRFSNTIWYDKSFG